MRTKEHLAKYQKEYRRKNAKKVKETERKYYQKNREERNLYGRKYYIKHREHRKKCDALYRRNNLENINEYQKEYRKENKEKLKEKNLRYRLENKDKIKLQRAQKYIQNRERIKAERKIYYKQNIDAIKKRRAFHARKPSARARHNAAGRRRDAIKLARLHPELDRKIERGLYEKAARLTESTGIVHNVDHIIPLKRGGWHHHLNLQILPKPVNSEKWANPFWEMEGYKSWRDVPEWLWPEKLVPEYKRLLSL